MVRTPVCAGNLNLAIDCICNATAWLVTLSAQVALATVVSHTFKSIEVNRIGGFQSPVIPAIGSVDLMAGTAVLAGWIWITSFNFIWSEIPVTVTFESDWRKAKQILGEIAERKSALTSEEAARQVERAASKFLIRYGHLTPIVWTSVADIGVTLTIRFLTEPRRRRSAEQAIWEEILDRFAASDDIDFAYPTQRFYDNVAEGKPGTRAAGGFDRTD